MGVELSTLGSFLAKTLSPFADAQSAVKSRARSSPPPASVGDRYIVGSPATGVWAGHASHIAEMQSTGFWTFVVPVAGISAWIADENAELFFDGTTWGSAEGVAAKRGIISPLNKRMRSRTTTYDGDRACDIPVLQTPIAGSRIYVELNGLRVPEVGDGTKTGAACWFSRDGGYTPLLLSAVSAGDCAYWQASVAGFELDASTDTIEFVYEVA